MYYLFKGCWSARFRGPQRLQTIVSAIIPAPPEVDGKTLLLMMLHF